MYLLNTDSKISVIKNIAIVGKITITIGKNIVNATDAKKTTNTKTERNKWRITKNALFFKINFKPFWKRAMYANT